MSIEYIIEDTCTQLINIYQNQNNGKTLLSNSMLHFPDYRNGSLRVSEQEARFLFSSLLEKNKEFRYSVETPTKALYSFTGTGKISAQTDITLWNLNGSSRMFNVEFKSNNPLPQHIFKDIKKLVEEDIPGIWFHLLKNSDSGTLPSLFGKFQKSLLELGDHRKKEILFAICVLEKGKNLIGRLSPTIKTEIELTNFFGEAQNLFLNPNSSHGQWWDLSQVLKVL